MIITCKHKCGKLSSDCDEKHFSKMILVACLLKRKEITLLYIAYSMSVEGLVLTK